MPTNNGFVRTGAGFDALTEMGSPAAQTESRYVASLNAMIKYILLFLFLPIGSFAQSSDTLTVQKKQIVFYSISQEEYDEIKQDPNSGVDEVISDMRYYANQYFKFNKDSLEVEFKISGSPYFRILTSQKDTLIQRKSLSHIVGFIANDGEKFIVKEGVFTDFDIAKIINENLNFCGN